MGYWVLRPAERDTMVLFDSESRLLVAATVAYGASLDSIRFEDWAQLANTLAVVFGRRRLAALAFP